MDMGTYNISSLRQIFCEEPVECVTAEARLLSNGPNQKCDEAFKGRWKFPNGGVGTIEANLRKTAFGLLPWMNLPSIVVTHKLMQIAMDDRTGEIHECVKTVTLPNFIGPHIWHNLEVVEEHSVKAKDSGKVLKTWKTVTKKTAYTWNDDSEERPEITKPGEVYWTTYRYMLEEFVNRIKGRSGSGVWVEGEDSIKQMVVIDQAYEKAGLPIRPTSTYK